MNIKVIGVFRFAIEDAINMLVRLEGKSYALPSIREFEEIEQRLSSTSPYDVVASILADNDYMSHKQIYMDAFGGVLDCEAFIGVVKADGRVVHYWDGLTEKLDESPDVDRVLYIEKVENVNGLVQESIRGMKGDLLNIWGGNPTPEAQQMPIELETPEAKKYLDKAIKLGLMDCNYKWLKGLQMLACFAREMSLRLHLGKGERISWKPFEVLFSIDAGKLRLNYNDIQKTGQAPIESYLIDKVFE